MASSAPAGDFSGSKAISTYAATFLVTMPLNWFTRKLGLRL